MRVTWESEPDINYLIEQSSDLLNWQALSSGIASEGDLTTVEIDLDILSLEKLFIRIESE